MKRTIGFLFRCLFARIKSKERNVAIPFSSKLMKDAFFEGNNVIGKNTIIYGKVGLGTYIGSNSRINADIGRFCSISWSVETLFGKHPFDHFVSTAPCFFSTRKQNGMTYVSEELFEELNYADPERKKAVIIENDVWIGSHAKLCGGITIHNGAVILAGAVVTHDVPPYAIVGGVPARLLRHRFPDDVIEKLQHFKWWEKDDQWLKSHVKEMTDIERMIEYIDSNS